MPRPKVIPAEIVKTIASPAILLSVSQAGRRGRGRRAQALSSGNLKSSWADSPKKSLHGAQGSHTDQRGSGIERELSQVTTWRKWLFTAGSVYPTPSIYANQSTFAIISFSQLPPSNGSSHFIDGKIELRDFFPCPSSPGDRQGHPSVELAAVCSPHFCVGMHSMNALPSKAQRWW